MAKISKFVARNKTASPLETPTDLSEDAVTTISEALNRLLADTYALYVKTKNFHWHVSGPHFRSYHLLFDEQATTIRSISHIERLQRIKDNDQEFVAPGDMLRELMNDNKTTMTAMREAHGIAEEHHDIGTASMLETFIDGAEKRNWFLFEASRGSDQTGH